MSRSLESLMFRLRAGDVRPGDLESARALVAGDVRVPDDLRVALFADASELSSDAAGVLAVLGFDDLGEVLLDGVRAEFAALASEVSAADVAAADGGEESWEPIRAALVDGIERESRSVDLVVQVMRRLPVAAFAHGALVSSAVEGEAGSIEVADQVSTDLGLALLPVAEAVRALGGTVDLADAVLGALGLLEAEVPVALAVSALAGPVDVGQRVEVALSLPVVDLAAAVRSEAGSVDVVAGVMSAIGVWKAEAEEAPAAVETAQPSPANTNRWGFAAYGLAAALLVSAAVWRLTPLTAELALEPGAVFAHAGEVVIEDLQYGGDVQVIQTEGDDGAVIIWIDEEA